jgi:hypothetical protein
MASTQPGKLTLQRPWYAVGKSMWGGTPFGTLGIDYCNWCRTEVDTDTDAEHHDNTYMYRRQCRRCGRVIACGAVNAPLLGGGKQATPIGKKTLIWIHTPGRDRS